MSLRWYVVNTFSGAEWHAAKRLREQPWINSKGEHAARCTEVWWPRYEASARRTRWELCRGVSHFPGYIFCALGIGQHAEHLKVDGVQSIISCDGQYLNIPQGVIDTLKARCADHPYSPLDAKDKPDPRWKAGTSVVIIDGPFRDFMGVIDSIDKCDELKIWIDAMGRKLPLEAIPASAVRQVTPSVARSA